MAVCTLLSWSLWSSPMLRLMSSRFTLLLDARFYRLPRLARPRWFTPRDLLDAELPLNEIAELRFCWLMFIFYLWILRETVLPSAPCSCLGTVVFSFSN